MWVHGTHHARHTLDAADIEEGLAAVSALGDDRIQWRIPGLRRVFSTDNLSGVPDLAALAAIAVRLVMRASSREPQ